MDDISQLKDVINSVNEQLLQTLHNVFPTCFSPFPLPLMKHWLYYTHNNDNKTNDSTIVNFMNGSAIFYAVAQCLHCTFSEWVFSVLCMYLAQKR